jgi:DNA-binding XRE family transcriptional regulator
VDVKKLQEMTSILRQIETLLRQQAELDELWKKFGQAVRETREEKRMTQDELSKAMGTSKSSLCYMENGLRSWNIQLAMKATEALTKS